MNILITGGTGFIGNHLIRKILFTTNHKVFILTRPTSDFWRIKDIKNQINLLEYKNLEDLEIIFKNNSFDTIIHLSALYIKRTDRWEDIASMNNINISFPSALLQLAVNNNTKVFINTGTCFEYKLPKTKIKETDLISPYNYYAATKIAFEDILRHFVAKKFIRAVTLKLFYGYGEKDNPKIIQEMINSVLNTKRIELTRGDQKISFTYVGDIVDAYIKSNDFVHSKGYEKYEVFNIGTDKVYTLKSIGRILEQISGKKNIFSFKCPYPENEVMFISCDFRKAKNVLNWFPKTNIMDGLRKTYNYTFKDIK